jgi:trigger factor
MMQATLENITALEKRLNISVALDQIESEVENRLKRLSRTVKMHGFRPGKVPLKVVAQQYGGQVRQEVLGDMVEKSFTEAVQEQKLRVAGFPNIEAKGEGQEGKAFEFTATFEVYPEVVVGDVSAKTIERPKVEVTESDIDKTIEILRKQRAVFEVVDRAAEASDQVDIDYHATIDGNDFEGGKAQGYVVTLGEGRLLPDFENAIVGMKAGESKTFDLSFPEDYHGKDVAGKTAVFQVTLNNALAPKMPEVDADFAKTLGVADGDLAKMRAEIRNNIEREVNKRLQDKLKEQVMQVLLDVSPVELPKALLNMEIDRLKDRARQDLVMRGVKAEDVPLPSEIFEEQAKRRVTLGLILGEVVKSQGLQAKPEQVRSKVEEYAQSYEKPAEVVKWYYENYTRLGEVESLVMENNVVAWVMDTAQVVDKDMSFDELMGITEK